jgi:hypothetical protein
MYHATRWLMLLGLLTPNAMQSDPIRRCISWYTPNIYPKLRYSGQATGLCPPVQSLPLQIIISSLALLLLRQPLEPLTLQSPLRVRPLHRPLCAVNVQFLPFL